jgi:hypothetical protein
MRGVQTLLVMIYAANGSELIYPNSILRQSDLPLLLIALLKKRNTAFLSLLEISKKIDRIAFFIYRTIKIFSAIFHFYIRLIKPLAIYCLFFSSDEIFFQF